MPQLVTRGHKMKPSSRAKVSLPDKKGQPIYDTVAWRSLLRHIIKVRGRRCEDPQHDPTEPTGRVYGDHIIEIRDGGEPLDPRNVMLRCPRCHGRKTSQERTKRAYRPTYQPNRENPT